MKEILKGFSGRVLIDGDIVLYRCAWASDKDPEYFALHSIKNTLTTLSQLFPNASEKRVYISDQGKNYRYDIAKTVPYKGQRGDKPKHYQACYDYLRDTWGARIAKGVEADDAIGWASSETSLIVSRDKDLWMLPGYFYDYVSESFKMSTGAGELVLDRTSKSPKLLGTGFKWFCAQMLLGDTADNIKGVNRVGPVKTYNYLNRIQEKKALWRAVRTIYRKHGMSKQRLWENAQLLWIQQEPGQTIPVIEGVPLWR